MGTKTVTNLTAVLQMNNSKFKKGLKGSGKAMSGFQKQMNALKGTIAATFAVGAIINFGKTAFKALDTQRKAEAALLTALQGRMGIQQELIKQAKELQKITLFGDEETIRAQSMIAAFVRTEATLKRVTPLVLDMATALGMDLVGAASLIAKTLGSSTNALSRYGITVTGSVGSTERLTSLTDGLSKAFKGQAEAAAEADVSLTQLKNRWGDLKEEIAGVIVNIGPATKSFFNTFGETEVSLWERFAGVFSFTKALEITAVAEALQMVRDVSPGQAQVADIFTGENLENVFRGMGMDKPAADAVDAIEGIDQALLKTIDTFEDFTILEDAFFSGLKGFAGSLALDWTTTEEALKNVNAEMNILDDQMKVWEDEWEEVFSSETFDKVSKMDTSLNKLGTTVGLMLVSQFDSLGEAITRTLKGAEGALQDLGEAILANLGNILIMAGFQTGNVPMIIAGAALQLGSGIIRGLGGSTPDAAVGRSGTGGANVNFTISGRNLQGVLNRNSSYIDQVT